MGLPTYNCTEEFAQRVPDLLAERGFSVAVSSRPRMLHSYTIRRGLGTVSFGGFIDKPSTPYMFFLTCARNPLLWFFDMRLLSRVEQVLLSCGATHWSPEDAHHAA